MPKGSILLYIEGDARDLGRYAEVSGAVIDFALARRQGSLVEPGWSQIFGSMMEQLQPGGLAVVTSLGSNEHKRMLDAFRELGHRPIYDRATRYRQRSSLGTRQSSMPFRIDYRVAAFRK